MSSSRPVSGSTLRRWIPSHPALADALARCGVSVAQLEVSVRPHGSGLRADRVMVERAPAAAFQAITGALGVPEGELSRLWIRRAADLSLPLIAGLDATRGCAKLYVNGSDAPRTHRRALAGLIGGCLRSAAPHVIGANLFPDGSREIKVYTQFDVGVVCGGPAELLRRQAGSLMAGVVRCTDESGARVATFVALRPASASDLDRAFAYLPGFGSAALAGALPGPAASPRSIGLSAEAPSRWTAYLKPEGVGAPSLWTLEPALRVRGEACEVHVFLRPAERSLRAYAVVGELALSYRVAAGAPDAAQLEALMRWVCLQAEREADTTSAWSEPPAPWARLSA